MTSFVASTLALLLAQGVPAGTPPSPQAAPSPGTKPAPAEPGTLARVNGEAVPLAGFEEWVVHAHGWRHVDDYVDLVLLRQEATRAGLALPTPAEIEAAFEQDWKEKCTLRGDEAALLAELARAGLDKAAYRDRQLGILEQTVLGRRILKARAPTETTLHELHAKLFGKEAIRTHLRLAFFDKLHQLPAGATASKEASEKMAGTAKERAASFRAKIETDRSQFAALVGGTDRCLVDRLDGAPVDTRASGGDLPIFRADWLGGQLGKPLAEAKSGDLVGPIDLPAGLYVVEVVERAPAPFERVGDELRRIWADRVPAAGEIYWLKDELRKAAKIEKFGLNR